MSLLVWVPIGSFGAFVIAFLLVGKIAWEIRLLQRRVGRVEESLDQMTRETFEVRREEGASTSRCLSTHGGAGMAPGTISLGGGKYRCVCGEEFSA